MIHIYRSLAAAAKLFAFSTCDLVHSSRFYFQDSFKSRCDLANFINLICNYVVLKLTEPRLKETFFTLAAQQPQPGGLHSGKTPARQRLLSPRLAVTVVSQVTPEVGLNQM